MGNSLSGAQYSFQQEPLHNNNPVAIPIHGNPTHINVAPENGNNINNNDNNVAGDNNRAGNFIINLGPRRGGMLDGDNIFGAIRNDLAAYFPFGRVAPPPPVHSTSSIKSLVNLHKDSVHLTRVSLPPRHDDASEKRIEDGEREGEQQVAGDQVEKEYAYNLAFVFDSLEACEVRIIFQSPPPLPSLSSSTGITKKSRYNSIPILFIIFYYCY